MGSRHSKILATNRKAFHTYEILERFEAGIVLKGTEVKSIRASQISIKESYARVMNGEVWLLGCHISPYSQGSRYNPDPVRDRKLLLHKKEITRLIVKSEQKGLTLVPLSVYLSKGRIKIELGLGQAKKLHDKRRVIKERAIKRDIDREIKG